jgi:hypothetical protein
MALEVEGLKNIGGKAFESTGKQDGYRISARIQKHVHGFGASEIRIWNLSPDSRGAFQRAETKVRVMAGWDNQGMALAFKGRLLHSQSNRAGPDIVTTLTAQSGREMCSIAAINSSWTGGSKVRDIVLNIARRLEGVTVDASRVKGISGVIGFKGWAHCGDAESALNNLAREFGFSWTIDNEVFQAVGDMDGFGNGVLVKAPNLIDVSPVLSGARRYQRGVTGRCTYNPVILPGEWIKVESTVNPNCNGRFVVNKVEINLDCFEDSGHTMSFTAHTREVK